MLTRALAATLMALAAWACTAREGNERADTTRGAGTPSEQQGAGADPGDCPTDTTVRHDDPVALVEEFVRRDAEGPFEREDFAKAWLDAALTCAARTTSDHYEIITGFRVSAGRRTPDTAYVLVSRDRAFQVARDDSGRPVRLQSAPGSWTDTVAVLRTRYGWRIHRIAGGAHRLPGMARGELRDLSAPDRARLDSLVARVGRE